MALTGRICIVTGATRGIGKGIALQLGEEGATVYITGRTLKAKEGSTGSLEGTAKEIESRGGTCIPVQCDHSKDTDIEELFKRVEQEQNGRLDLLVNNAYAAVNYLADNFNKKFYELPPDAWDFVNNVGLRNHYMCSVYASRLMVKQKHGLIIWVSSPGGLRYLFNVAYGVGKAACDRMAADMAFELRKSHVACISLWPGAVRTENIMDSILNPSKQSLGGGEMVKVFENGESIEFAGKAVASLLKDKNVMQRSGKILMTSELANQYGYADIDGRKPGSMRSVSFMLGMNGYPWLSYLCPTFIKLPYWMLHMGSSKF